MPVIISGVQYSGRWNLQAQAQADAAGTWPSPPFVEGELWQWGYNNQGQLGDGTTVSKSSPVQVGALTTWASVISGYQNNLAIKSDSTLWAWGAGASGQLGQGNTSAYSSPVQIGAH